MNAFLPPFLYNDSDANRKALPDISRSRRDDLCDSTHAVAGLCPDCSHVSFLVNTVFIDSKILLEHFMIGLHTLHTNPKRERGECLRTLAGASG